MSLHRAPTPAAPPAVPHREAVMSGTVVCPLDRLTPDRGVAALVGGRPVAIFRLEGDELYAIDHVDPCSGAPVLARGLVGSCGDVPTVASPLHKQRFDLRTGRCLDDPTRSVRTWPVRLVDGMVIVDDSGGSAPG